MEQVGQCLPIQLVPEATARKLGFGGFDGSGQTHGLLSINITSMLHGPIRLLPSTKRWF